MIIDLYKQNVLTGDNAGVGVFGFGYAAANQRYKRCNYNIN